MKIKEALRVSSKIVPPKEARVVLSYHLKKDQIWLMLNENESLEDKDQFFLLIDKLKNSVPIEYITKSVSFYSKDFFIDKGALIPRPESELLVDVTNATIEKNSIKTIAEIGVGSGVLSIILLLLNPRLRVIATDISSKAIEIAKINAKKYGVLDRIEFHHCSYLDGVLDDIELVLSNPPYIKNGFELDPKLSYEPDIALFGGEVGDEILKDIIDLVFQKDINYLCCEIGYNQKESLKYYMKKKGVKDLEFYKDLSSFDRGFVARIR